MAESWRVPEQKKRSIVPTGYIFAPDLSTRRDYERGEIITWTLTLVGNLQKYLPVWIRAFEIVGSELGLGREEARFDLIEVTDDATDEHLYPGHLKPAESIWLDEFDTVSQIQQLVIDFITPVLFKHDKRIVTRMTDEIAPRFLANLYTRCFALSQLYCKLPEDQGKPTTAQDVALKPTASFQHSVEAIHLLDEKMDQAFFSRLSKGKVVHHRGLLGPLALGGPLTPLMKLLQFGTLVHWGKKASEGYGRYYIPDQYIN